MNLVNQLSDLSAVLSSENLQPKHIGRLLVSIHGSFVYQSAWASSLLKKKSNKCNKISDVIDLSFTIFKKFPYNLVGWGITPDQVAEELHELLKIIKEKKPNSILEIGTSLGGTLFSILKVSGAQTKMISVDRRYDLWRIPYYRSFASQNQKVTLLRADSHNTSTLNKVRRILGNTKLDVLFIDADHTYNGVRRDFAMYSGLVRKGGLVVFHDICKQQRHDVEVDRFWREIKNIYSHYKEIIKNPDQGWAGIGVLWT